MYLQIRPVLELFAAPGAPEGGRGPLQGGVHLAQMTPQGGPTAQDATAARTATLRQRRVRLWGGVGDRGYVLGATMRSIDI